MAAGAGMTDLTCRRTPCLGCPYRRDVPSGIWAPEEYDKLRLYDAPTGEQPPRVFVCHATPGRLCHGWAVVHEGRGHAFALLALRFLRHDPRVPAVGPVPLFASGNDAADHGLDDVEAPSPAAVGMMDRLSRYPHLAEEGETC